MTIAGVIGGGAWGTALAATAARAELEVKLWAFEKEVVDDVNSNNINSHFLPDIPLSKNITATGNYGDLADAAFILMVCPAQFMRAISAEMIKHIPDNIPLVICSKGIEKTTGMLMSEVLSETCPNNPIAVLSGPTFAGEVATGMPSAVTMACANEKVLDLLVSSMGISMFRCYGSNDIIGAQIGGSVKNVLAIACGIITGKKMGENARAALITRGLAEMIRFGEAKGAKGETLMGMCGLGDLFLTCSSAQSRNTSLGIELGEGHNWEEIVSKRKSVTEGAHIAGILHKLAGELGIEMPIVETVYQILHEGVDVDTAIRTLLERPAGQEFL
ncbi:MAG: NAD(P)-dependent glycerol-3-phosphate dehydrogenase [Sphingomonadales bacterium]|nr:NAD(P)-dependent glycerol-3-phosphate dehydrogenase [Sphingomonadales bacterium]